MLRQEPASQGRFAMSTECARFEKHAPANPPRMYCRRSRQDGKSGSCEVRRLQEGADPSQKLSRRNCPAWVEAWKVIRRLGKLRRTAIANISLTVLRSSRVPQPDVPASAAWSCWSGNYRRKRAFEMPIPELLGTQRSRWSARSQRCVPWLTDVSL